MGRDLNQKMSNIDTAIYKCTRSSRTFRGKRDEWLLCQARGMHQLKEANNVNMTHFAVSLVPTPSATIPQAFCCLYGISPKQTTVPSAPPWHV